MINRWDASKLWAELLATYKTDKQKNLTVTL